MNELNLRRIWCKNRYWSAKTKFF